MPVQNRSPLPLSYNEAKKLFGRLYGNNKRTGPSLIIILVYSRPLRLPGIIVLKTVAPL